jgi:hypothetical protein
MLVLSSVGRAIIDEVLDWILDLLTTFRSQIQIIVTWSLFPQFAVHYSTQFSVLSLILDVSW